MTSSEVFDARVHGVDNVSYSVGVGVGDGGVGYNDTYNSSVSYSDPSVSPMSLAGIIATSIILGVMTLTTIVGEKMTQKIASPFYEAQRGWTLQMEAFRNWDVAQWLKLPSPWVRITTSPRQL